VTLIIGHDFEFIEDLVQPSEPTDPPCLTADVDGSGIVDSYDYIAIKRAMGSINFYGYQDTNGDGDVDFADLQTLLAQMGQSTGPCYQRELTCGEEPALASASEEELQAEPELQAESEPEPKPEPEPVPKPEPETTGGGTWTGNRGATTGGGGTAKLGMEIEENCAGKEITVSVLNPSDNPAKNATVTIYTLAWKSIEEQKSNEEGKAIFVLETGKYTIRATKSGYMVNTKQITVEECKKEPELTEETPVQNDEKFQKTPLKSQNQETQEQQTLQQNQEQKTTTQTGLFSFEGNNKRTTTAAMAGVFVAMLVGAVLYLRKKN